MYAIDKEMRACFGKGKANVCAVGAVETGS